MKLRSWDHLLIQTFCYPELISGVCIVCFGSSSKSSSLFQLCFVTVVCSEGLKLKCPHIFLYIVLHFFCTKYLKDTMMIFLEGGEKNSNYCPASLFFNVILEVWNSLWAVYRPYMMYYQVVSFYQNKVLQWKKQPRGTMLIVIVDIYLSLVKSACFLQQ